MITGQIKKIVAEHPEEATRYNEFLSKFGMVDKIGKKKNTQILPDTAYCTMAESQGVCAQLKGTQKLKNDKLMEVHKLLFNQDVGGQLHNALVDISVTLRVYLKLIANIDICQTMSKLAVNPTTLSNNNEICNLINPIPIREGEAVENVNYSGELITGLDSTPRGLVEETVNVQSVANKMARDLVSTSITICSKQLETEVEECQREMPLTAKLSRSFVSGIMSPFTRKNKVVPMGGRKKRRSIKRKRSRTVKRNKRYYK